MTLRRIGLIALGVVSLAIAIGVPILAHRDYRDEPGFDPAYVPRVLPAQVVIEPSAAMYAEAVRGAMVRINQAARCTLLVEGPRGDVRVMGVLGEPCGPETTREGTTTYCTDGTRTVQMANIVEFGRETEVALHELLHALGHFRHDPWGAMNPAATPSIITGRDRDELARLCK